MSEILLSTFANKVYRDKLAIKGMSVIELEQPLNDDRLSDISKNGFNGTAVIEIIEDSMGKLRPVLELFRKNSVRIIALSAKINNVFRSYFLANGISEVIESNNADRLVEYVDITEKNGNKKYGKIIIFDDCASRINIFNTIVNRFNHSPLIINTIDELFENLPGSNTQLILLNLGTKKFDLNYFLRKSYSSDVIKRTLVPFKDSGEGLFIHEMISGLNKIVKVILTADEVYSFLVDILFRKDLAPGIKLLNEILDFENLNRFASETLSRNYTMMGAEIFSMKKIITRDNISIIDGRIESLKNLVIKVDGLKWLINDDNNPSIGHVVKS